MTTLPVRRTASIWPFELAGFPWPNMFGRAIRVEEFTEDETYVVRAEIPGVDPEKDVRVELTDGLLHIHGERTDIRKEASRSEFHYGSFSRTLSLPAGAKDDSAAATYRNGVLEVRVELGSAAERAHQVPVKII